MLTKAQIKRRIYRVIGKINRKKLANRTFSILSNNCWGGEVYDNYALQYLTPTVGLWIPPKDYLRLLKNPDYYLNRELIQIGYQESHVADLLTSRKQAGRYHFELDDLVIGRLDDVDIIFIHYQSFQDAKLKWDKRKTRLNTDNLIVKFCDQNGCTYDDYIEFCELPYNNKLFFTSNKEWNQYPFCYIVHQIDKDGRADDTKRGAVPIDLTAYLNSLTIQKGVE